VRPAKSLPPAPHALRVYSGDLLTLDPGLAVDRYSGNIIDQLFRGLLDYTPELSIVPGVAASWEVLGDGCRYLFHLREDVLWSDGVPVTALDFEYAWRRVLDPVTRSPLAHVLYDIKGARAFHAGRCGDLGVQALDDTTLVVDLERPTGYFLQLLATCTTYPVPRHLVEGRGSAWVDPGVIVTNGPFNVVSWQPGHSLVLERYLRNPGPGTGNLRQVQVTLPDAGESSGRLEMYKAGLLDVLELEDESPEARASMRNMFASDYVSLPSAGVNFLAFDVSHPPFDDPRVRRAFAHALDRVWFVDKVGLGQFLPATGGFLPPGMPAHVPGIALPYDPEYARELLADAGYPGGASFPVVEMLAPAHRPDLWDSIVGQWHDNLGVAIRPDDSIIAWAEYLDRVHNAPPHIYLNGWVGDYPDPDNYLRVAVQLHSAWHHPQYLEAVERARCTLDQAGRMDLYAQAQRILSEEVPILPLTYGRLHWLVKPWVRRYPVSASGGIFWKDVVLEAH
jgi:oligopeptide transport system substrate-binding protein